MCMPTNFGSRKKSISKFQRSDKKDNKKKEDNFFKDADEFLGKKYETSNIKS